MIASAGPSVAATLSLPGRLARLGVSLADLTADSRAVKLGSVFAAYPGTTRDGRAFIAEAIARGAGAVLWERQGFAWDPRWAVPNLGIDNLRGAISEIAGFAYGNPSHALWMAGVTGTNGKTSVAQWIAHALNALGRRSAALGTVGNGLVGEAAEAKNTTPDAIVLQRLLADYVRRGAKAAAMEVSSHGLEQGRVAGIRFDTAVFTNLTRDHLDYHGTLEAYAEAKFRLFAAPGLRTAVVNADDPWGRKLAERLAGSPVRLASYGIERAAQWRASRIRLSGSGVQFDVEGPEGPGSVAVPVLGAFNVSNLLAVLATLHAAGVAFDAALRALENLRPVPGRLERIGGGELPLVVVDYAHTPDALEKALVALRAIVGPAAPPGPGITCVFGCGGERDAGKRPMMGRIAAQLADRVIVTSDNPRGEDPARIIADILAGIPAGRAEGIAERQVAIYEAVHGARAGDVVLLAGKGHETYQEIAGVRHPFSDAEVARAALSGGRP